MDALWLLELPVWSSCCWAGNNANPGTSPSAPKQTLDGFDYNALPAGIRLRFQTRDVVIERNHPRQHLQ